MITKEMIRKELEEVRYYYSRKKLFDKATDSVGKNDIIGVVEKYNRAICEAKPRLYEVYISVYIDGYTYEAAAADLGYSPSYIYKTNRKVLEFLYQYFNKEAV